MTLPPLAGIGRRLGSLLYEALLLAALLLTAAAVFQPLFAWLDHSAALDALFQLYLLGVLYAYCDWSWRRGGQTLAMKTWQLRLLREDGQGLDQRSATLRFAVLAFLLLALPALSYLAWGRILSPRQASTLAALWLILPYAWAGFDPDKQFLHDRLAKTRLVMAPRPPARKK